MGNKPSAEDRRHSVDGQLSKGDETKSKKNKKGSSKKRPVSVPDLASKSQGGPVALDVKIYRSTSTIDEVQKRSQNATRAVGSDIRIYRRNAAGGAAAAAADGDDDADQASPRCPSRTQTLPRNFGRSGGSDRNSLTSGSSQLTMSKSRPDESAARLPREAARSTGGRLYDGRDSVSAASFDGKSGTAPRPPSRASLHCGSSASTVTPDDFPDTPSVVRRLRQFETRFTDRFTALYLALPDTVQLSALSIAVRRHSTDNGVSDHVHQDAATVSLWNYVRSTTNTDTPADMPLDQFALTVHPALFDRIVRLCCLRQGNGGSGDSAGIMSDADFANALQVLTRDIVSAVAAEAAVSVSTAFEYQIALLGDGLPCQLLADRAADCAMDYLKKTNRHLDVNAVVDGVVYGRPVDNHRVATVSVFIGNQREFKWNIDEILYKVGLRKDRLLVAASVDAVGGYGTPWQFFTSSTSADIIDPMQYGYRGQLLHRDYEADASTPSGSSPPTLFYRFDADEEATFKVEVMWRSDDLHRLYRPFRRLVGTDVMQAFLEQAAENVVSNLAEYVQLVHGDAWRRDVVEPVYRPINAVLMRRRQQVAPRPRCVSDAVEFSRQHAARRTWSPAHAAAMSTTGNARTPGLAYRPKPEAGNGFVSPPADVSRHPPNTAPVLVGDVSNRGTLLSSPTAGVALQTQHSASGEGVNLACHPPFVPATSLRRSFISVPAAARERDREMRTLSANQRWQTPASSVSTSPPASANNVSAGFPTLEELFAKELRSMRSSKAVHVTDFPVFDDEPTTTTTTTTLTKSDGPSSTAGSPVTNTGTVTRDDFAIQRESGGSRAHSGSSVPSPTGPVVVSFVPCQPPVNGQSSSPPVGDENSNFARWKPTNKAMHRDSGCGSLESPQSPTSSVIGYGNAATTTSVDGSRTKSLIISNI